MSFTEKNNSYNRAFRPLQFVTIPYHHWVEKRRLAQEIQETQRKIAEATNNELLHFHENLWSHWPDAAQHVRQQIHREETFHE